MKNFKYIWLIGLSFFSISFTACNEEDDYFDEDFQNKPITISKVYLEDAESSVPDREVTFARLGQVIRVEGSGFYGIKKIYVNGYDTYFNRTYVTDNNVIFQLNDDTPISEAAPEERDLIRFVKDGAEGTFNFTIRAASPTITHISNTLPQAGETVTVYGTNLHETSRITLPGDVEITSGITCDNEEGEWYAFIMPAGIAECGSITSEGANGTAITPAYFNDNRCYILNFDDLGERGVWGWSETGSMCDDEHDLVNDPLNSGRGKCAQIVPERMLTGADGGIVPGKPRATEWWSSGKDNEEQGLSDWSRMFEFIPATTPVSEVALQFDVYIPEAWSGTGCIQICLINNYNFAGIGSDDDGTTSLTTFYVPWIEEGEIVPFMTESWQTVTIPFSEFNKYATLIEEEEEEPTFQMVVDDRNAATYNNFGMGFVNTDFTYGGIEVLSSLFNKRIYTDNWRVVPCESFTVSDYPEDEEETEE